jgi:hypothetical protein
MTRGLTTINLAQLYRGYVLSFASLDIPVRADERDLPLLEHKVMTYFANLGTSLGFASWSVDKGRNLEWWSHSSLVLRLECETDPSRLDETVVRKLATCGEAAHRVGILFSRKGPTELKALLFAHRKNLADALLVTTYWKRHMEAPEEAEEREKFLVTGHVVRETKIAEFPRACLVWPRQGPLHMYFPDEGNWE